MSVNWAPRKATTMSATKGRLSARGFQALVILVVVSGLTGAHFLVAHGTHGLREIHIVLGGMYLIPIIAAALWFGLRGAVATSHRGCAQLSDDSLPPPYQSVHVNHSKRRVSEVKPQRGRVITFPDAPHPNRNTIPTWGMERGTLRPAARS